MQNLPLLIFIISIDNISAFVSIILGILYLSELGRIGLNLIIGGVYMIMAVMFFTAYILTCIGDIKFQIKFHLVMSSLYILLGVILNIVDIGVPFIGMGISGLIVSFQMFMFTEYGLKRNTEEVEAKV